MTATNLEASSASSPHVPRQPDSICPPDADRRPHIAALMTCHNRAATTLRALQHLHAQVGAACQLSVYLVDDGSSDGTADLVARAYPEVTIIPGDGTLFWGGGMARAFEAASRGEHDFFLWLNDDTYLFPDAVRTLLQTHAEITRTQGADCIVVGTTRPEGAKKANTGGRSSSPPRLFHFELIEPCDRPQRCTTFNGNCVLVPRRVAEQIGGPDAGFRHYIGDFDYGLRAKKRGFESWVAPGFAGTCQSDRIAEPSARGLRAFCQMLADLRRPKGVQVDGATVYSFQEWARFARRHGGPFWFIYFAFPYRRLLKCLIPRSPR
jgi:GT2 family glycosyltransferase